MRAVFLPGAGRSGPSTRPQQAGRPPEPDTVERVFLSHEDLGDAAAEQASALTRSLGTAPGHVVAHSAGAVPALLAAAGTTDRVRSLVLFEQACFASVRGGAEVERHIAEMSPVFDAAEDDGVSDGEFAARFLRALGAPAPDPDDPDARAMGRRLRAAGPPWRHPVDLGVVEHVPTLVVTGGWNALYEEVAAGFARAGARHVVLAGHQHRPQDHPEADSQLVMHWRRHSRG